MVSSPIRRPLPPRGRPAGAPRPAAGPRPVPAPWARPAPAAKAPPPPPEPAPEPEPDTSFDPAALEAPAAAESQDELPVTGMPDNEFTKWREAVPAPAPEAPSTTDPGDGDLEAVIMVGSDEPLVEPVPVKSLLTPLPAPEPELLGEVITWAVPAGELALDTLRDALTAAGFDPGAIRDMQARNAYARACRKLAEDRVIRRVSETDAEYRFQFTREYADESGVGLAYERECVLVFDKKANTIAPVEITDTAYQMAERATELFAHILAHRTAADVTRCVQHLFETQADLFPIREQGGAYFVPVRHRAFVDRVERFLAAASGRLLRFPVPAGTPAGNRSVRQAMSDGLAAAVAEYREAIRAIEPDARASTFERAAERLARARVKVEGYSECLADERERLLAAVTEAEAELAAKLAEKEAKAA